MAGVSRQTGGVSTTNTTGESLSIDVPAVAVRPSIRPRSAPANEYDVAYVEALGDPAALPWWEGGPCPALVTWLNAVAPQVIRPGARTAVTCCGLGDDAALLVDRGYDVSAFDVAPAAIAWARARHPRAANCFHVCDLRETPVGWHGRFDFVVDVNAVCHAQDRAAHLVGARTLMTTRAVLLVICHGHGKGQLGAPRALASTELSEAAHAAGLEVVGEIGDFEDEGAAGGPRHRLRGLLRKADAPRGA
ncbi:MAG: methyltransferase domain-containing protein [Phycisphaerales bacterium]|nr:methyltransferase domain-containing protein [Phycisphaerales bacterium]